MAGQGITVSILAKIEGWLDLIKLIQNAMKNIKPGSDISKGLIKDLQLVNDMVNNLGKNMNQRLTSDSLITGFVDKIMLVEEVFGRLGTSMSHISFGDINPEYITAGFKDLLSTLELANNALGQGMESSFQNAIANSKTLLKEFERMKIDPKTMNIDAVREALAERGKSLEKDVNDGLKKLTDFEKGLEKLKNARDELTARDKFLGKDANATALSLLIGHQLPTKGTILDSDKLAEQVSFFRNNLLRAGFTPTQLNRIIPDLETVMKAGHWDEMPAKFAQYLREAQVRTQNSLTKASNDYKDAVLLHQSMVGALNHLSSLRFNNTLAQNEVGNILSGTVQNDTRSLRDVVNNLKQQLEQAATSGFKGLGSKLFSSSLQGMQDASVAMKDYSAALDLVKAKELAVSKVQGVVLRYFSIYAAVRMVSKGIRSMMNNIKELDKTITEIAIVTKMDQNDLWGLMPLYTKLAKNYAASISGVYKVSQLYYQQGLGQQDVMALTELTLKMARISGLDYAEATDYMTNAVRSFKMEMTDAATVVDVYSAVAASSASSVTELATAMSKTASSAAAVGSSFENTTAMLAVMIEATRESPENIGSAMKSIISRYGELKENKTGIDEEGEEYSLNKVDKALLTVGISIHDANGEFRDFDDVIFELAEKWNTIDKNTLRYIATVMAGNRQQSRFLALVSSTERLKEESEKAANSEDASQLQFLKTMDSIEAKTQLFLTSLLSLYTSSGLEKLYKGLLDFGNEFANTLENISGKNGLAGAISNVGASFINMASLATTGFSFLKSRMLSTKISYESGAKIDALKLDVKTYDDLLKNLKANPVTKPSTLLNANGLPVDDTEYKAWEKLVKETLDKYDEANALLTKEEKDLKIRQAGINKLAKRLGLGMAASAAGMALSAWANSIDINENRGLKGGLTIGSSALLGLGTGLMVGASAGGPIGALVGALTALPGVLSGAGMLIETMAERVLHLEKDITDTKNLKLKSKDELKTLEDYKKKYDELSKSLYESAEKKKEFMELSNSIAASYPELIKSMDAEGNYILNMAEGYERLAEAKRSAYQESLINSIAVETAGLKDADYVLKNVYGQAPLQNKRAWHGLFDTSSIESLMGIDYKDFTEEEKTQVANLLTNRETANLVFSNLKDEKGNLMDFYSFGPNLAAQLSTVYLEFINKINENKDYSTAVSEILEQLGDSYTWLIEAFGTDVYKELKTRKDLPEYLEKLIDNATSAYNTELVNLLADQTEETFDITSNDILKRFVKELISKEFTAWRSSLDTETLTNPEKWQEAVKNFYNKYDAVWYKIEYESDLISGLSDDINDLYQDMGKHTKADIRKLFPEGELTDILQLLLKWLEDIFDLDFEDVFELYDHFIQNNEEDFTIGDSNLLTTLSNFKNLVGPDFLLGIMDQYLTILDNKSLTTEIKNNQLLGLTNVLQSISNLLGEDLISALALFLTADLTSLVGIYKFIDKLKDLNIDSGIIDNLTNFSKDIVVNLNTELNTYLNDVANSMKDFESAVSSASKGMDFKTAVETALKIGVNISKFLFRDGKYYTDNFDAIKEAYLGNLTDLLNALQESSLLMIETYRKTSNYTITNLSGGLVDWAKIRSGGYTVLALQNVLSDNEKEFMERTGLDANSFVLMYSDFLTNLLHNKSPITDFNDFIENNINSLTLSAIEKGELYAHTAIASAALAVDNLDEYFKNVFLANGNTTFKADELTKIAKDLLNGKDFESLLDFIPMAFREQLKDYIDDAKDNFYDFFTLGKHGQTIKSNEINSGMLEQAAGAGLIKELGTVDKVTTYEMMKITLDSIDDYINFLKSNPAEENEDLLAEALEWKITNSKYTALTNVLQESFAYTDALAFTKAAGKTVEETDSFMEEIGAVYNEATGLFEHTEESLDNLEAVIDQMEKDIPEGMDPKIYQDYINGLRERLLNLRNSERALKEKTLSEIFNNYKSLSTELLKDLAKVLEMNYNDVLYYLTTDNLDGTYKFDITKFHDLVLNGTIQLTKTLLENLADAIELTYSDITSDIEGLFSLNLSGNKYSSVIGKARKLLEQSGDSTLFLSDLIEYNDLLGGYILTSKAIELEFAQLRKKEGKLLIDAQDRKMTAILALLKVTQEEKVPYGEEDSEIIFKEVEYAELYLAITDSSLYETDEEREMAYNQLDALLAEYDLWSLLEENVGESFGSFLLNCAAAMQDRTQIVQDLVNLVAFSYIAEQDYESIAEGLGAHLLNTLKSLLQQISPDMKDFDLLFGNVWTDLLLGRFDTLNSWLGTASLPALSDTIQQNARESYLESIVTAGDELTSLIGEHVSARAVEALTAANYRITTLSDGTGIIEGIGNVVDAYINLYNTLKSNSDATTNQLNSLYIKVLNSLELGDIDAISVMGEAMSMTYDALGTLLTQYGIKLEDWLTENSDIYLKIGGGKIRITDFTSFADLMGWLPGSEEYTSAFKSYNDGLIELNTLRKHEITDEISKIKDIKPGDWINLTKTEKAFKDYSQSQIDAITANRKLSEGALKSIEKSSFYNKLSNSLARFGAYFDDGILKTIDNANLIGIAQTLADAAETAGTEMSAELLDMVLSILKSYTDAITKGIEGGMTNTEKEDLVKKAQDLGITDLSFTETTEGLKLSLESAISLYHLIYNLNKILGKVTFEALSKNLLENNTNYKTSTKLLTHISTLLKKITTLTKQDAEKNKERIEQLKEELSVAKLISETNYRDKEADWSWRNRNATPDSFENSMEYWKDWYTALNDVDSWTKNGLVEVNSFLSLMAHAEEVANATGGELNFFGSSLGLYGKYTYNWIADILPSITKLDKKTGEYVVTLKDLKNSFDIDFSLGQKGLAKESKEQILGYTKDIEQLDAAYNTFYSGLDEVRLMLEDPNVGGFSFDDYFDDKAGFNYTKFTSDIKKRAKAWDYFKEFTKLITVDEKKWSLLEKEMGAEGSGTKAMQSIINMAMSLNWDEGTDQQVIAENLAKSGIGKATVKLFDQTYHVENGRVIIETGKTGEGRFITPDGENLGSNWTDAIRKILENELDNFNKLMHLYELKTGESEFTINELNYHVTIKDGKYIIEGGGQTAEISTDGGTAAITAWQKATANKKAMSDEAFTLWMQRLPKKGKTAYLPKSINEPGTDISDKTRSWLLNNGIDDPQLLLATFDSYMKSYKEKGLKYEDGLLEFEVETGIKYTAKEGGMDAETAKKIIDLNQLTQMAADVKAGIDKAFEAEGTVASTITSSILKAFSEPFPVDVDTLGALEKIEALKKQLTTLETSVPSISINITDNASGPLEEIIGLLSEIKSKTITVSAVTSVVNGVSNVIDNVVSTFGNLFGGRATGTVGLAHAKSTLMGELGPELVVSNNRYFVVGLNGPEFVDLANDAIVFNHLQTQSLLTKGTSNTRGRAITNERNAVAYAKGSMSGGPAKGGGLGGRRTLGDNGNSKIGESSLNASSTKVDDTTKDIKAFIKELERWYNWLQEIAELETEINYLEALREKFTSSFTRSGSDYFKSLKNTLDLLQEELAVLLDLLEAQKAYFELRRSELNSDVNPYSSLFVFDEKGQIKYKNKGFEEFENLLGADKFNNPNYTPEEQMNYLMNTLGLSADYFTYDKSGNKIDLSKDGWQLTGMQAFWDKMEALKEEMLGLHDDINERTLKIEEIENNENEILHEIEDNQIEVENKVLKAVEENHLREIDALQDLRDAIEESATKMIDGLSDALSKEQEMYNTLAEADELQKLQRQLAIMQRSGGSAAQIADLQEQIADKQLSLYFDIQQLLIDALQAASDAELERLDHQIDLMQETLDYLKEYGLLWNEVNTVLLGTPEQIAAFIKENTSEYWNKSATDIAKTIREDLFDIDRFKAYLELMEKGVDLFDGMYGEEVAKKKEEKAKALSTEAAGSGGGSGGSGGNSGGGTGGNKGSSDKGSYKVFSNGVETYFSSKSEATKFRNEELKKTKNAIIAEYNKEKEDALAHATNDAEKKAIEKEYQALIAQADNEASARIGQVEQLTGKEAEEYLQSIAETSSTKTDTKKETKTDTKTATEHKNSAGNIYYTAKDPETGKTISGNAWYMKQHGIKVASGGYVNHGIYELGELGTETVLTASQTKVLRDNILSNRPDSLINLLKSYNEAYHGLSQSTYDSISNNSNEITIERAEVNLLIEKLADDYDSKRAANTIMDEMLRIASKTSANNSVRR